MIEMKNDRYAQAVRPLAEAVRLSPFNWKYLDNLAVAQSESGQVEAALNTYESISKLDPEALLPYLDRARLYVRLGEVENVRKLLERTANLIKKEDIANSAHNNGNWFFRSGKQKVYLPDLEAKRAYVHGSRAAILYVVSEEERARGAARLIPKLSAEDIAGVTRLIRYDLEQLAQKRGDLGSRAQRFAGWWRQRLAGRQ